MPPNNINDMCAAGSALNECKDRLVDAREKCKADAVAVAAQAAQLRRSLTAVDLPLAKGLVATGMPTSLRSVLRLMKCCDPIRGGCVPCECAKVNAWAPSVTGCVGSLAWAAKSGDPSARAIGEASGQRVCARIDAPVVFLTDRAGPMINDQCSINS